MFSALTDPAALLWLILLAIALFSIRKRQLLAGASLLTLVFLWWGLEVTRLPARLLAGLERPYHAAAPVPPSQAIIVLGGVCTADPDSPLGLEFNSAIDRKLVGIELSRQKAGPTLVLGGGVGRDPGAAHGGDLVAAWIHSWKLTPAEVIVLPPSRTTHDEALHSAALAQERKWNEVILVTSAFHLKRASATFRAAGLAVIPVGSDFEGHAALQKPRNYIPRIGTLTLLQRWLHEVVGYAYYRLRGWT